MIFLLDDICVIHIPNPHSRGCVAVFRAFCSKYSIYRLATVGLTGEPIAALQLQEEAVEYIGMCHSSM